VVLGSLAPTPLRLPEVERRLVRRRPRTPARLSAVASCWLGRDHPLANNEWKLDASVGLLERALERCLGGLG